jgi:3-oxoacyl-[acyl-carrier-protein] synthase II
LALAAAGRALTDAELPPGTAALERCGVFVGCATGPTESVTAAYDARAARGRMPGLTLLRCLPNGAAAAVALRHGLRGAQHTYANACASSALAIGEAMRAIRHGYLDLALVGGTECPFGEGTLMAWEALRVLAPAEPDASSACRPFDHGRRGLVLGEGAAFFVLESAAHAAARDVRRHAVLAGFGASSDAHHWTEPCPAGQEQAMRAALADAGVATSEVGAINAHGTGTPIGDKVETQSIARVFGSDRRGAPWVTSTKGTHGHWLGASGAIEFAASIASLTRQQVPPTRNLEAVDEGCSLRLAHTEAVPLPRGRAVLSNSFAFGGSNACLVVKAA